MNEENQNPENVNPPMQDNPRQVSPMENARRNAQNGFAQNPYIVANVGEVTVARDNPYINNANAVQGEANTGSFFDSFDTSNFIKGALIGAVGAYLLTNEDAQKAIFKGISKGSNLLQAGIEEMKERFEDAKAEMDAER